MNGKTIFKYAAVVAAVVCVGSARVYASTVNAASDDTNMLALANGTLLPTGALVQIGTFSINDATILADQNSPTTLQGAFSVFGSFTIGQGTVDGGHPQGYPGTFSGAANNTGAGFASQQIYMMVFDTTAAGTAGQVGVFKGIQTGGAAWIFPANVNTGSTGIDLDDALTSPVVGSYLANGPTSEFAGGPVNVLELHAVPEPSTYLLVGTGLLGLLGLRRRRS